MSKFGLPSGEKETTQLKTRFNNYRKDMKKKGMWGQGEHETHLHRQNSFYQFNKPEYDKKTKSGDGKVRKEAIDRAKKMHTTKH